MTELVQTFPRRVDGELVRATWTVDLAVAQRLAGLGDAGRRLRREVTEMARHFPRWILTVGTDDRDLLPCTTCGGMLVFDRGVRCVVCDRACRKRRWGAARTRLAWFGLMPPIGVDGLARVKRGLVSKPPAKHVVGHQAGIGHYLLVPLLALYPPDFPRVPIHVAYLRGFFEIPGIPKRGMAHEYHMLDKRTMCLYAGGQWSRETTCCQVLQQRAYAHVIKFLNYGNGKKSAFAVVT